MVARAGRYGGGTYAHKDIAFEFGTWLSPEFKLYLIKEFQRLKEDENIRLSLEWDLNRTLAKLNYRIHTDAIKSHIIPPLIDKYRKTMMFEYSQNPFDHLINPRLLDLKVGLNWYFRCKAVYADKFKYSESRFSSEEIKWLSMW